MNLLLKTSALTSVLVLALTTGVKAITPNPLDSATTTPSPILLAQSLGAHGGPDDYFDLTEMIIDNMKMLQMGMKAMKSDDPAMKKMGEQMMNTANANLQVLLPKLNIRMTSPR